MNIETKICSSCRESKLIDDFYVRPDRSDKYQSYCKSCFNTYCKERWVSKKYQAVEYKGSCCEDCALHVKDTQICVFDFHHLNPLEKEFNWKKLRLRSWDSIKKELDKCALLCANCHRVRHFEID